jgi:hypothetical protein
VNVRICAAREISLRKIGRANPFSGARLELAKGFEPPTG